MMINMYRGDPTGLPPSVRDSESAETDAGRDVLASGTVMK